MKCLLDRARKLIANEARPEGRGKASKRSVWFDRMVIQIPRSSVEKRTIKVIAKMTEYVW